MNALHGYQLPVESQSSVSQIFNESQPELVDLVEDSRNHKPAAFSTNADPNLAFSIQSLPGALSGQTIVVNMDDPTNSFHINV